jgi:hypothetical protein
MSDLYQLLLMVDGQGIWTLFAETHEEAEQVGRRLVETERKKGVDMTMGVTHLTNVDEATRKVFVGKRYNLTPPK